MSGQKLRQTMILVQSKGVVVRQSTNTLAIPHEQVARALRIIWEHYTESIDVASVADQLPLSYQQLHTVFVRYVGHTMSDELTQRRLEHAQRLLAKTDAKLAHVAEQSGFGNAGRMGRVFMRKLSMTPANIASR